MYKYLKMRIQIILGLFFLVFPIYAQDPAKGGAEGMTQKELFIITDKFVENKIYFNFPEGTYPVQQVEQYDVFYDLAYRVGYEGIEYRVVFHPNESFIQDNQDFKEAVYLMMITMSFNISQQSDEIPEIIELNNSFVEEIFNADYGVMTIIEGNSMFSSGYKYILLTAVHKKDKGTLYSFILSDEYKQLKEIDSDIFKYMSSFYFFKYDDKPY